ncbi:MAG: UDP-N-acetylmuramate--L-alanine ligase, partial [Myxococcota bacterium]
TLESAREAYKRRLVVAFQPHRYSRTRDLLDEFAGAFNASDALLVTDIYAASEQPIEGIDAEALVGVVRSHGHQNVDYGGSPEAVAARLESMVGEGDLVLTLGAGNIWQAGEALLERLGEREGGDA